MSFLPLARFRPFDRGFSGNSLHGNHFFTKRIHFAQYVYDIQAKFASASASLRFT
ncbi:hypothetical protein [Ruegeria arenilitoris]|uniref:hypothetical protein n=1 Tax=Ruegeria arenilitoris TaxID=1173585 RepID=UPI00147C5D8C|nr:hypothetical protein [Ruegeria arenilitoris]